MTAFISIFHRTSYSAKKLGFSILFICVFLKSSDEWTYRFNVVDTLECPSISDNDLISMLFITQLVAYVCLKEWKFDLKLYNLQIRWKPYWILLGSEIFLLLV